MANLWLKTQADWSEPEEDWRNTRPNKFGKSPEELHGNIDHVDEYFQGNPTRPVPWKQAVVKKTQHLYDKDAVRKCLQNPDHPLEDVDPRELRASQPSVVRSAAQHYMTGEHEKTGKTFENSGNVGNKHPVVFHDNDTGQRTLLSGHHRAFVALAQGRPLRAKVVRGRRTPR